MVQFVNSQISHAAKYGQLQPKMTGDAKFPSEFRVLRTVEEIRAMDRMSLAQMNPRCVVLISEQLLRSIGYPGLTVYRLIYAR